MTREIDLRVQGGYFEEDKRENRQTELENVATQISDVLPGEHRISIESFDAVTGNPRRSPRNPRQRRRATMCSGPWSTCRISAQPWAW